MDMRLLAALCITLLAGCATTAQFRSVMDGFVGRSISEAEDAFGTATTVRPSRDGQSYTWVRVHTGVIPGSQSPTTIRSTPVGEATQITITPGTVVPPQTYREYCEFTLITDAQGRVTRWRATGDACVGNPVRPVMHGGERR